MKDLQPILTEILKKISIKALSVKYIQVIEIKKHVYKERKQTTHVR